MSKFPDSSISYCTSDFLSLLTVLARYPILASPCWWEIPSVGSVVVLCTDTSPRYSDDIHLSGHVSHITEAHSLRTNVTYSIVGFMQCLICIISEFVVCSKVINLKKKKKKATGGPKTLYKTVQWDILI